MRFAPDYHNESSPDIICCDIGRITRIDEFDYIVARTRHCNKHSMQMSNACWNCYIEVLTYSSAKPVMVIECPQNGMYDSVKETRAVLASLSASPAGFIANEWKSVSEEPPILVEASKYCSRLGQPKSSVAFVFSDNGTKHAPPYNYERVFKQFWNLTVKMASSIKQPILVFYAETLKADIARHPEVKVLVIEEHFPINLENMMVIRDWWQSNEKQAVIAFGSGEGFSAEMDMPGLQPSAKAFPGVLELIGLSQAEPRQIVLNEKLVLDDVSRIKRSSCLGDELEFEVSGIANLRRVFGSRANVLYEATIGEEKIPVVAEWRDRTTLALFCGFGIFNNTLDAAEKILKYALKDVDAKQQILFNISDNLLWSENKNEYIVACNLSDEDGAASINIGRADLWDCIDQNIADISDGQIHVKPNNFKVFRIVGRRSKFLDVLGVTSLNDLIDGAGRAELNIYAGKSTTLVLRTPPKEVLVDGRITPTTNELVNGNYNVTLRQCAPGQRYITVKW